MTSARHNFTVRLNNETEEQRLLRLQVLRRNTTLRTQTETDYEFFEKMLP